MKNDLSEGQLASAEGIKLTGGDVAVWQEAVRNHFLAQPAVAEVAG